MDWQCPYCERLTTLIGQQITTGVIQSQSDESKPQQSYYGRLVMLTCPNSSCKKTTVSVELYSKATYSFGYHVIEKNLILRRRLIPATRSSQLHDSVPVAIIEDYEEAHAILFDSPKSAATLARRALQGMIRDFHSVTKPTLYKEIEALKGVVDSDIWDAIDAVRKVGNIGAHMEKDVNVIIDVEPGEAELLLNLIDLLSNEWYKAKSERSQRLADMKKLGDQKTAAKRAKPN